MATSTPRPAPPAPTSLPATATPAAAAPLSLTASLTTTSARPGETVGYTAHTAPGASVSVTITGPRGQSRTTQARLANAEGVVSGSYTIPPIAPAGVYQFTVVSVFGGQRSQVSLTARIVG